MTASPGSDQSDHAAARNTCEHEVNPVRIGVALPMSIVARASEVQVFGEQKSKRQRSGLRGKGNELAAKSQHPR